jgi:hypothetical protein
MNGFMLKTFVFENELTYQSSSMQIPIPFDCQAINIEQIMYFFKQMNSISEMVMVRVYDPIINSYVELNIEGGLDKRFLFSPMVMIKYRINIPRS